ncbi:MAG TPA: AbrB/MazE/SpoVT family DNA-binding domain-containing protein [Thermoanaerobaculia bacterium]|nr:AbrB/MazE/SpoVT family DNA-binding domain-containing protein [Thermoanaerobaculia bacterium]
MGKITSKYQVSIPKALAERVGVKPGDDVEWRVAGHEFRVVPGRSTEKVVSTEERLKMFDAGTRRQAARNGRRRVEATSTRGWKREDLYDRGRTR